MELVLNTMQDASVATNVGEVVSYCKSMLEKYRGCVATPDTLRDDKRACADINRLKKFASDQRIAFTKKVMSCDTVSLVISSLKEIENACDEIRDPYWATVKAIEDADKPKEERMDGACITFDNILPSEIKKVLAYVSKYLPDVRTRPGK